MGGVVAARATSTQGPRMAVHENGVELLAAIDTELHAGAKVERRRAPLDSFGRFVLPSLLDRRILAN